MAPRTAGVPEGILRRRQDMQPSRHLTSVPPSREALIAGFLLCLAIVLVLVLLIVRPVLGQQKLTAAEAKQHIGETATVCGNVVSTRYAPSTKGQPTFLNLDKPYPNQIFTVLIWGSDRSKFGKPEADFREKRICATGKITVYREVPEIVASDPQQIKTE